MRVAREPPVVVFLQELGICSVNKPLGRPGLGVAGIVGSVLFFNPTAAQILPPARKAAQVQITKGPELELARDDLAIIRWTSTNPGGDDEHFGVVHYGTDPKDLIQTAKSHIRLNQGHPETIFRVRMDGLKPQTTYYYTVTSMGADGENDGVETPVNQFTNAARGEQIVSYPQPK
jgi:Purple acid Phosphatase, N-terminal domain